MKDRDRREFIAAGMTAVGVGLAGCSVNLGEDDSASRQGEVFSPDDLRGADGFGYSLDVEAGTALVGAPRQDDSAGEDGGAAYVYERREGTWGRASKLIPYDGMPKDQFGYEVGLAGEMAVIGAPGDELRQNSIGSVYVFDRTGTGWEQQAKLVSDTDEHGFGAAVDVSGNRIVVGSFESSDNGGVVYLFERTDDGWDRLLRTTLSADFGWDAGGVAIDGDTVFVGETGSDARRGEVAGAVLVFTRTEQGSWIHQSEIVPDSRFRNQRFGANIAVDGDRVAVADAPTPEQAEVYGTSVTIFERAGETWEEQTRLAVGQTASNDVPPLDVALRGDTALVGDSLTGDDSAERGTAYLYERRDDGWEQLETLVPAADEDDLMFGATVVLGGETAFVTAQNQNTVETDGGAVHWYGY